MKWKRFYFIEWKFLFHSLSFYFFSRISIVGHKVAFIEYFHVVITSFVLYKYYLIYYCLYVSVSNFHSHAIRDWELDDMKHDIPL